MNSILHSLQLYWATSYPWGLTFLLSTNFSSAKLILFASSPDRDPHNQTFCNMSSVGTLTTNSSTSFRFSKVRLRDDIEKAKYLGSKDAGIIKEKVAKLCDPSLLQVVISTVRQEVKFFAYFKLRNDVIKIR